jgi:hypothetical protein
MAINNIPYMCSYHSQGEKASIAAVVVVVVAFVD